MALDQLHIDENNVAFVPSLGITFQLNDTGKRILELLQEGRSKDEIVLALAKEFGADWKRVYRDVEDFMLKLKIYGLIQ